MPIDVMRARRETPGCAHVLHFNNAGAALMPQPVIDAVQAHLKLEATTGGYEAAAFAEDAIANAYHAIAEMLGCTPGEVAFTQNASRAWQMAFYSIPFQSGDRILTSSVSYVSNYLAFLHMAQTRGVTIEVVPDDEQGQLSVEALRTAIDERVRLIAIDHVPTSSGLVNPAAQVGRVAREAGVLYLLDACQSAGQMPLDVTALGCDMLSATGRKFMRAPRGTGFLYVRDEVLGQLEPPIVELGAAEWVAPGRYKLYPDARRFETWETNIAAKIGLGVAVDYAMGWGLDAIWARVRKLAASLRARLGALPGVTVYDRGAVKCGIVTFTVADKTPEQIRDAMKPHNINVWLTDVGSARLDLEARGLAGGLVRASIHYYNSEEEVERFCRMLERVT